MKRTPIFIFVLVMAVCVSMALANGSEDKSKTVEGTLVDTMCYFKEGFTANTHRGVLNCGTACAKMGIPVGLLTAGGKVYVLVGPSLQLASHVGKGARVTGTVKQGSLVPEKVEVKKGDSWEEVKIATMM